MKRFDSGRTRAVGSLARRWPLPWAIVVTAILVAATGTLAVRTVHDRAHSNELIADEYVRIGMLSDRIAVAEYMVLDDPTGPIAEVIVSDANPLVDSFALLKQFAPEAEYRAVATAFETYSAGLQEAQQLVIAGDREGASRLMETRVRPDGDRFRTIVTDLIPEAEHRADRFQRIETLVSYTLLGVTSGIVALLVLLIRHQQQGARETLRQKQQIAAEQAVFWRIGELTVSDFDMHRVLPEIASSVLGIIETECCSIEIWEPGSEETQLLAEATIDEWPGVAEFPLTLELSNYPRTRIVLESGEPQRVRASDSDLSTEEKEMFAEFGTAVQLLMPLVVDRRCFGVLTMHTRSEDAFDERAIALARELTALVALAIENARSRSAIKRHTAEQERLLKVTAEAEERYRTLVEQIPAITYVEPLESAPAGMAYEYVSPQVESMLGYEIEAWLRDPELRVRILHPDDRDRVLENDARSHRTGEPFREEYRVYAADGRIVWLYDETTLVRDETGEPLFWHGIKLNTTAVKEAEAKQIEAESEFRLLFSRNPHPTLVCDRETLELLEVNESAVLDYGYGRDELLRMRLCDLAADPERSCPAAFESLTGPEEHVCRTQHRLRDGRHIEVELFSHPLTFRQRPAILIIAQDITARHELEAQLAHQAYHDTLTALPNRAFFTDRLSSALKGSAPVSALFIDLDNFKVTNDTLGHSAGDQLLLLVGERLLRGIRPGDTLARLGGDEFTVLVENGGERAATAVAARLRDILAEPFLIEGHEIVVTASIGIASGNPNEDTADDMLRRADLAMYEAKHRGRAQHAVFNPAMNAVAWKRLALESELRRAIQDEQLRLHFQPIVELESNELVEVEALVRWEHPERGLVSPDEFIPLAEETGLIVPLGLWVLREACSAAAEWHTISTGPDRITVGVNLSTRQFSQPALVDEIAQVLAETGFPAGWLKIEITESVAMHDLPSTVATLQRLKALGVRLAIDDFGTGFSGLSYLRSCPIDTLKIDRSFIAGLGRSNGDTALVRAVIAFANTLNVDVTAEGVETPEQVEQLRLLGCKLAQGYLFSRPLPAEELVALLRGEPVELYG